MDSKKWDKNIKSLERRSIMSTIEARMNLLKKCLQKFRLQRQQELDAYNKKRAVREQDLDLVALLRAKGIH